LQPRITKTLLDALLDLSKPLTTHYGAIVGLSALGHYVIQLLVLPNLKTYIKLLEPELNSAAPIKRMEARKCFEALLVTTIFFFFFFGFFSIQLENLVLGLTMLLIPYTT